MIAKLMQALTSGSTGRAMLAQLATGWGIRTLADLHDTLQADIADATAQLAELTASRDELTAENARLDELARGKTVELIDELPAPATVWCSECGHDVLATSMANHMAITHGAIADPVTA